MNGRINTDILKAVQIELSPLPEQKAIAHILGTLDDKMEYLL
ncbi:restriction endonuclease subunit S [Nostoc sp.]